MKNRYLPFLTAILPCLSAAADTASDIRYTEPHETVLVSRATGTAGVKSDYHSEGAALSADGRFAAFTTWADNLDPAITGPCWDQGSYPWLPGPAQVYVRDLQTHETVLVSRASGEDGQPGNGCDTDWFGFALAAPAISGDGRYVVFESDATNLDPDHPGEYSPQLYVRDRQTHQTRLISRASGAQSAPGFGGTLMADMRPSISTDGRYVIFQSQYANLHPDVGAGALGYRVYLRDLQTHETLLISRADGAAGAVAHSPAFVSSMNSISADGRYALFLTDAANVHSEADGRSHVYRRDLQTHENLLVSRAGGAGGALANQNALGASLSGDGRYVAFGSNATNLHPDAAAGTTQVYVRDLHTDELILVSRAAGAQGAVADTHAYNVEIAFSGRYVAFSSIAGNLHPDAAGGQEHIYVRDLHTDQTILVSRADGAQGAPGNGTSWSFLSPNTLSANGRYAGFSSGATNLHPDDSDDIRDVFVRDLLGPPALAVEPAWLDFGEVAMGESSAPQGVTLTNTGTADVTVEAIPDFDEADFVPAGGSCGSPPFILAPEQSCTLEYRFDPTGLGLERVSGTVASDTVFSPHPVLLRGTGSSGLVTIPGLLDFGGTVTGGSAGPETVVLTNQRSTAITMSEVAVTDIDGPDNPFRLTGGSCGEPPITLSPEQSCTLGYVFEPFFEGPSAVTVTISHDAPGDTDTFALLGTGLPAQAVLEIAPESLEANLVQGQTGTQTLTVGNTGVDNLVWMIDSAAPLAGMEIFGLPAPSLMGEAADCDNERGLIIHDDGRVDQGYSTDPLTSTRAVYVDRFSPTAHPVLFRAVCVAFLSTGPESLDFEIVIYDDSGDNGGPGRELGAWSATFSDLPQVPPIPPEPVWLSVDISALGFIIESGDIYIGVRWAPSDPNVFIAADHSPDRPPGFAGGYWWSEAEEAWVPIHESTLTDYRALFVRAVENPGGCFSPEAFSWLSMSPEAGAVAPGGSGEIEIHIDAAGLVPGHYAANLCISSNDPAQPLTIVPVTLTVSEAAPGMLGVDPTELDFGELAVGASGTLSFTVSNAADLGAADLELTAIDPSGDSAFDVSFDDCNVGTVLAPQKSCTVEVRFSPGEEGAFTGEVSVITADDQSETVTLSGAAFDPGSEIFRDRFEERLEKSD